MNSSVSLGFRLIKLIAGIVLIIIGAGLFMILTSAINEAQSMGGPMNLHPLAILGYWPGVLFLDAVFLSLVFGGVKLAGFSRRIFGLILILAGIGTLSLGIRNHINGPPLDYDSTRIEDNKMHVPSELNIIVYFWSGLTILGGVLLATLSNRSRAQEE